MDSVVFIILGFLSIFVVVIKCEDCENEYGFEESCPKPNDPSDYSRCCWQNQTLSCCSSSSYMDDSLVMMISVFVIIMCLALSILFVICCFWSPCPLYSVCRINYTYGDIVAYSKAEEALNLPPENFDKNHSYTPLHVTVKSVEEE